MPNSRGRFAVHWWVAGAIFLLIGEFLWSHTLGLQDFFPESTKSREAGGYTFWAADRGVTLKARVRVNKFVFGSSFPVIDFHMENNSQKTIFVPRNGIFLKYDERRLEPCCSDGGEFFGAEGAIIVSDGARVLPNGSVKFKGSSSGVAFPTTVTLIVKASFVSGGDSVEFRPRFIHN